MSTIVTVLRKTEDELADLYQEHGYGVPQEVLNQTREPIDALAVAPEAFQFRDMSHREGEKEHHVRKLSQAFRRQEGFLDPLLLFAVAGHRLVLDGHCRLRAYLRADLSPATKVPVRYCKGDFSDALTLPASENVKAKLALTQEERLEAAWKLVRFDETRGNYSLRGIATNVGCGKSTVGNMRKVLETGAGLDDDPRDLTWKEVKRGRRKNREHDPDWKEKIVDRWSKDIRRALGGDPNEMPNLLFRALEESYPRIFPQSIPRGWAEDAGITDELLNEAVEDFEF